MKTKLFLFCLVFVAFSVRAQEGEVKLGLPLGHTDSVLSASFSPDGRMILTMSYDGTAKLWEVSTGRLIYAIGGAWGMLYSANFSPDGKSIITAWEDGKARIWEVLGAELQYELIGHKNKVTSALFSSNGRTIATTSQYEAVKLWDGKTGNHLVTLGGNSKGASYLTFSPDGVTLATNSFDKPIIENYRNISYNAHIWDVSTGSHVLSLDGHSDFVNHVAFCTDGSKIVTASRDATAKIWDTANGTLLHTLEGVKESVLYAEFSPDDKMIITLSNNRTNIWDITNGELLFIINQQLEHVAYSPDGKCIAAITFDGKLKIWDSKSGNELCGFGNENSQDEIWPYSWGCIIRSFSFSSDSRNIVVPTCENTIRLWDIITGKLLNTLEGKNNSILSANFLDEDNKIVLIKENIQIVDKSNGHLLYNSRNYSDSTTIIVHSPDYRAFVTSSNEIAQLWDINGRLLLTYYAENAEIDEVSFSPNGKLLNIKLSNNVNQIWGVENTQLQSRFTSGIYNGSSYFSPSGEFLFIASDNDGSAEMWNVYLGELMFRLQNGNDYFEQVTFSPNEKVLLTVFSDGEVRALSVNSGKLLYRLIDDETVWESAFFGPRGIMAVVSQSEKIQLIDAKSGNSLCEVKGKFAAFSPDEKIVLTYSENVVNAWSASNGELLYELINSMFSVDKIVFSPDGNNVAISNLDKIVSIWDINSGKFVHKLEGHLDFIETIVYDINGHLIMTSSRDGCFILWDSSTGEKLLQHFVFDDKETLTLHSSGLFDATLGAMDKMYWVKGLETIDFGQLKGRYWEPGLWEKVMKGEKLRDLRGMNELKSAPEVLLGEIQNNILPVILKKRDGGYGKVVVLINGKEVLADARGGNELDTAALEQQLFIDIANNPLLIPGKENTIAVKAWSEDGFVEGRGVEVVYTPEGNEAPETPSLFAVICGVSEYHRGNINLRYAAPDADAIATAMQLGGEKLFGKEKTHIYTLTSPGKVLPTKENIRKTFEEISQTAKPEDVLVLYISGHGITWGGDYGDFYYLTSEAFSTQSDAFNDPAIREKTAIGSREFTEWIKEIPALKQVMIIDACGSGKAVDNLLAMRNVDASQIKAIDRMKDRTGMFIISGCAADAVSYEASRYGQGLLTYSLLQGMKGAALREDKYIDVNTVLGYAREQVPQMAQGIGGIQTPQLLIPKSGSFDIGLLDENDRKQIPLSNPKPVFVRSTFVNTDESEDNLSLSLFLDEYLNDLSSKGTDSQLIFVDSRQYPDGCRVSGTYFYFGNMWKLKGAVKCGEIKNEFEISVSEAEELRQQLIERIEEIAAKL